VLVSATSPCRGRARALPLTSSAVISLDCCRTTVTTLFGPRRVATLSNVSTGSPPRLTTSLKVSSPPSSEAGCTSTEMLSGFSTLGNAETVSEGRAPSPAAGSSAAGGCPLVAATPSPPTRITYAVPPPLRK